ncbi:uncharacterized protein PAC_11102 [Phialocephala subalpina]|uniref:Vegetative cell wall protein gp1 n=1 Tax=Phialocephala subalpina TaxID=576137 RepID=A0A1L7X868_9HELO|nr:uncharacterized protein PAC_11102 [Phialocephala subalpina]
MNTYTPYSTPPPGFTGAGNYPYSATPSPAGSPSGGAHGYYRPGTARPGPSPRHHTRNTSTGDAFGYSPRGAFSPRYNSSGYYATANAQGAYYDREESPYDNDPLPRRRRQSSSTPQRPHTTRPTQAPRKPNPIAVATEADARKHRIPPGYSLKNWDPSEEPIMLLGSVFDANSLGKWIYDWTVYHHGPATPIADMAGELWLLLIQLAGKVKRAEECMDRIRTKENREMVDDFIESGERLTDKLKKLLKACETPMLKAGRKTGRDSSQLGKNAGTEFVDSIFGRDRELEATEKFMSSIRLWNLRFDANCEDILRRPGQ